MQRIGWIIGLSLWALVARAQDSVSVNLINGDVTRDNQIDDADLMAVLLAFGSNQSQADLNEDNTVDDADMSIALFGFGQVGATPFTGTRVYASGSHFLNVQVQLADAGATRWREVRIEAQRQDDVLVYQAEGWIQGASGTVSLALPEAGIYRVQVWVANGSWLRAERQVTVGLQVRDLIARPGNGSAVLMWEELPNDSFSGYRVYRRSGTGQWTQIATLPASTFLYADTGLTNGVGYSYKLAVIGLDGTVVHESSTVSVVPTAAVARLLWDSQSFTDTSLRVSVRMSSGQIPVGYTALLVNGIPWGGLGEYSDAPGKLQGSITLSDLPLGSHALQAVLVTATNAFVTPVINLTFGSNVGVLQVPNLMYMGGIARFRMELPSDVVSWQVKVVQHDNQEVRSWSGSSSLMDVVWDGRDASGNDTGEGLYWVQVSALRASGSTVSASRPLTRLPRIPGPLDAIALLDTSSALHPMAMVEEANWIAARLEIIKRRSGIRYYVYLYSPSIHGRPAHRRFVEDLVNLMSSTLTIFFASAHGNEFAFRWGEYLFIAVGGGTWPRGRVISVPSVVGNREYRFVFGHWCRSALTDNWADAFNAECFLGWRTGIPMEQYVAPGVLDDFTWFVMYIWGDLAAGYRISQALNFTCGPPGRLRGRPPCSVYRWTCDPTIWFGFCPDITLP